MAEWMIKILEIHGLAGLVIFALAWAYWRKDKEVVRLNKEIFNITTKCINDVKDLTIMHIESANSSNKTIDNLTKAFGQGGD